MAKGRRLVHHLNLDSLADDELELTRVSPSSFFAPAPPRPPDPPSRARQRSPADVPARDQARQGGSELEGSGRGTGTGG